MAKIAGKCLCGEIRYEVSGEPITSLNCYCRDCQYISGGSQNSSIFVSKSTFTITKGNPNSYFSKSNSGIGVTRLFCGKCGTPLFAESEGLKDLIGIKVGSIDELNSFTSSANLWVSSSQPWHHFDPDVPAYDKQPS